MRVLTVLGTRPQIVKAGVVSRALAAAGHEEILLHTGQHRDPALTGVHAEGDGPPAPARSLGIGPGSHASQVAEAARGVAAFAAETKPAVVLAAGDTNSALAAGLGARAAGIPLAHGEAGVRLGELSLPEEVNRVALDHLADLALCPTARAASSLAAERPRGKVVFAGDPLLDALPEPGGPWADLPAGGWFLATLHRAENTDDLIRLRRLLEGLASLPLPVLLPLHPRTRAAVERLGPGTLAGSLRPSPPVPHRELLDLARGARAVLTDSGGLQREAYWLGVPCIVLRGATEWTETVDSGWAVLVGADPDRIRAAAAAPPRGAAPADRAAFGGGRAAERWAQALGERFG
jgi:UDP-N-acetylglucosamine 2-epimerase